MNTLLDSAEDNGELSRWWFYAIGMVIVFGLLLTITLLAYRNAPPIPDRVVDLQSATLFTSADISNGQIVFLKYGLMNNGSIWWHGGYLGPDYAAQALHNIGLATADALAVEQTGKHFAELDATQQAGLHAQTAVTLKRNRYDATTDTLVFTAAETIAWETQIGYWRDYFRDPAGNGGLKPNLISDPQELHEFAAFVT